FGVALFRKPKSKIFVLQATMRCLRSIGSIQERANIYLSDENVQILAEELDQNFRMSIEDLTENESSNRQYNVQIVPPQIPIKINHTKKLYDIKEKEVKDLIDFEFDKLDVDKYKLIHTEQIGLVTGKTFKKV